MFHPSFPAPLLLTCLWETSSHSPKLKLLLSGRESPTGADLGSPVPSANALSISSPISPALTGTRNAELSCRPRSGRADSAGRTSGDTSSSAGLSPELPRTRPCSQSVLCCSTNQLVSGSWMQSQTRVQMGGARKFKLAQVDARPIGYFLYYRN